jgi:hypothetical protein
MLGLPDAMTDWTKLYFLVEKRVSPRLEQLTRTAGFLDVVAVANGVSWMATRTVRDCGSSLVEGLGLPSGRQLARLQQGMAVLQTHAEREMLGESA